MNHAERGRPWPAFHYRAQRRVTSAQACACTAILLATILVGIPAGAQQAGVGQQSQGTQPVPGPPPVPGGVIPLPQGPPPTGPQASLPPPVRRLPSGGRPLLFSPPLATIQAYATNHTLTIRDAVAIALYTNRSFALAEAQLVQARGRTGQARSALGPQATVAADLTYFDQATTANLGSLGGGGTAGPSLVLTPQFNPTITSSVALPLDVTGVLHAAVSQAQFAEVAARIEVNRVRNQIVYDVKAAFYNGLRAQAQLVVATDNLNNALTRLNDANLQYGAGTAPRFDVITAQRDAAVAQQGVIDARSQVSLALAALKNTMGVDIKSRVAITDAGAVETPPGVAAPAVPPPGPNAPPFVPPGGAAPQAPPTTPNPAAPTATGPVQLVERPDISPVEDPLQFGPEFTALLDEALKTRPEVLESDAQIAAAQHGVTFARRSMLPSLNVALSDIYTPNATGFSRRNVGAATLGIRIPVFDSGLARSRVEEARGTVAAAEIGRRTATDQVQIDVQQAYIGLTQARNRVAVANVGLAQAREAYRLALVRYRTGVSQQPGVSPQVELSQAQTSLAQAQSNQVNALYDYNNARAQLDRAVGRYGFTGAPPGYPSPLPTTVPGARR